MDMEMTEGSPRLQPSATFLSHNDGQDRARLDQDRERRLPKDYAAAVSKFSVRTNKHSLHPGIHFRTLALFLNGKAYTTPGPAQQNNSTREHTFAVIHDLAYDRHDNRRVTSFDSLQGLDAFSAHTLPHDDCGQLLFLRGYPSNRWVNTIGAKYRIDPEIFRRHLTLGHKDDFYDLPGPSSSSHNIVRLPTTSLGKRNENTTGRRNGPKELREYFSLLGTSQDGVGESLVRKFAVHDEEHFSIEQDMCISVIRRGEGWLALILLDQGRDLDEGPKGPWLKKTHQTRRFDAVFYPVIQFEPGICFKEQDKSDTDTASQQPTTGHNRPFFQSATLLPSQQYGRFLSSNIMKAEAFYALSDLFTFCASSEHQFLNCLSAKFDAETQPEDDQEQMAVSLRNLRYHKSMVHEHIESLRATLTCIRGRGSHKWPRLRPLTDPNRKPSPGRRPSEMTLDPIRRTPTSQSVNPQDPLAAYNSQLAQSQAATDALVEVYEGLLRRAQTLWQSYSGAIEDIRTSTMLAESRKATRQQEGVARLTFLAFLFLPLSFTTSVFGMNFQELGTSGHLSIWIWVVVSIPIFIFALVLCFWSKVASFLGKIFRWHRQKPYREDKSGRSQTWQS